MNIPEMPRDSFIGYTVSAMQKLGFSREDIKRVVSELYWQLDETTEEQAAENYKKL